MAVRFSRILVPTDFGSASDAALECAKELARRFDACLYVLHVVEDPTATGVWTPDIYIAASAELRDRLLDDARRRLEAMFTEHERQQFNPLAEARVGSAAEVIGEFAREQTIDLIVMGTHGRRGLSHMFLGSVAERMVRTAPCAVLTLHAAQRRHATQEAEAVCAVDVQVQHPNP